MSPDDLQELNELLEQIRSMKVHASNRLGAALKKPLLLLLLVSQIENDRAEQNRFHFDDIEKKLGRLIREHGGRPADSGPKPEQPFCHLRSSPFWVLRTQREYAPGTTALISDLRRLESYGAFRPKVFRLLRSSGDARARVVDSVLNEWWPETLHGDIREDLGLDRLDSRRRPQRDQQFTIDVLENFRYSCAFCGFHAVLNGQATGIDAGHIHWHSLHGPDDVENGIALCKLHHWAFDKGILGIDDEERICMAGAFVAQQDGGLPLESLVNRCLAVQPRNKAMAKRFLNWHRNNVYLGAAQ
ncbi:MAG: phosphorothioated DNA-binding restriction endonuclease [Thermoguttaceae bacterium]|jgi:putative restriction endonuclease